MPSDPSQSDTDQPGSGAAGEDRPQASEAAEAAAAAKASSPHRTKQIVAGAALGIGSAALVAALLYANRSRKGDKRGD
ncbi:MAG TPA: hypothetical protein VF552_08465 [Allosphingosinicella sp.]|jgi:hypothetical protein